MTPGTERRASAQVLRALAGLEAGVLGGLVMLAWLALASTLERRSAWFVPNVLGSLFYGRAALRRSFGMTTISGLALHLFVAGTIGMLFGVLVGDSRNRVRVVLLGVLAGLTWYYFSQALLWRELGVLAVLYASARSLIVGHIFYGLVLGSYPVVLAGLKTRLAMPPVSAGPKSDSLVE